MKRFYYLMNVKGPGAHTHNMQCPRCGRDVGITLVQSVADDKYEAFFGHFAAICRHKEALDIFLMLKEDKTILWEEA